jgi:TetR/AcrR family transcriptional repressor of nem operon
MRYKPEHKEETHRRIVEAAAKEFRAHGFEGVGIAKLMGALELTHGGFYAHFADKEDLVAEACIVALDQSLENMLAGLESQGFPAVLDYYLSEDQRDHPASACMLPALAAEVARRPSTSRQAFTAKLSEIYNAIAKYMPGQTHERKFEKVSVMFASMVGAMSLARAVSDPVLSKAILRSTREHLLRFIEAGVE